jgi:hypothetical protein
MQAQNHLNRRSLMLAAGTACGLPNLAFAKSLQAKTLILGLVKNRSLYAMAVQHDTSGINWASAIDNDNLTNGIQVDTIFGSKPPLRLHAYDLNGSPLNRTIKTSWTRFARPDEAGDWGFNVIASPSSLPHTYLASSEHFDPGTAGVGSNLTWNEILKLQARFKRDAFAQLAPSRFDELARTLLKQTDLIYTGNKIEFASVGWIITTINALRKAETYPRKLKLTWVEAPGMPTAIYCGFDLEEFVSLEFVGAWQLTNEKRPVVFVGSFHKAGMDYSATSDTSNPALTVSLGGSGC